MRYDADRAVYRDCRWCQGRGCLYCKTEADKTYGATFGDGPPVPLITFDTTTPEGIEEARSVLSADAMRKAFGSGGGGMKEIARNIGKVLEKREQSNDKSPPEQSNN